MAPQDDGDGAGDPSAQLGRAPLLLEPYYRAGGRIDGAWRLTWLSLAPAAVRRTEDVVLKQEIVPQKLSGDPVQARRMIRLFARRR